jgi:hypothetical protein
MSASVRGSAAGVAVAVVNVVTGAGANDNVVVSVLRVVARVVVSRNAAG